MLGPNRQLHGLSSSASFITHEATASLSAFGKRATPPRPLLRAGAGRRAASIGVPRSGPGGGGGSRAASRVRTLGVSGIRNSASWGYGARSETRNSFRISNAPRPLGSAHSAAANSSVGFLEAGRRRGLGGGAPPFVWSPDGRAAPLSGPDRRASGPPIRSRELGGGGGGGVRSLAACACAWRSRGGCTLWSWPRALYCLEVRMLKRQHLRPPLAATDVSRMNLRGGRAAARRGTGLTLACRVPYHQHATRVESRMCLRALHCMVVFLRLSEWWSTALRGPH